MDGWMGWDGMVIIGLGSPMSPFGANKSITSLLLFLNFTSICLQGDCDRDDQCSGNLFYCNTLQMPLLVQSL